MRWSARTWTIISVLLLGGFALCWHLGNERVAERQTPAAPIQPAAGVITTNAAASFPLLTPLAAQTEREALEAAAAAEAKKRHPYQVTNTRKHVGQLMRSETALLLQNALIETAEGTTLPIPAHLKSQGHPGAYIVQARGPIDNAFRQRLADAGAKIVSYVPNNAYLVEVSEIGRNLIEATARPQAIIPYEPQFKLLDTNLLAHAYAQRELPGGLKLNVTGFPSGRSSRAELVALGATILHEEPSPFGPRYLVELAPGSLVALAQSPAIQHLETWHPWRLMNDFMRRRLNVATNLDAASANYLGLSGSNTLGGSNITLGIIDSGVDAGHADLAGRVTAWQPSGLTDLIGHGTHMAGTMISSGTNGNIGTNASGSTTNANMRGIAYAASLYSQYLFDFGGTYAMQTNMAMHNYYALLKTNPMVVNNSWGDAFNPNYSLDAASFDAAVRDSLPETNGMQPMLYVFAAGNEGFGSDSGTGGFPDSISAPGTAKNVITVGAIENARFITNATLVTNVFGTNVVIFTNRVFYAVTDSSNQVAAFSSRGNVAAGVEGPFGRFKPDVVAPGSFTVSTTSTNWSLAQWVSTNNPIYDPLLALNARLATSYRYESGTSSSAAGVSGMLGLIQEFFESTLVTNYSPALLKAVLINGARGVSSFSPSYGYALSATINYQGWGLPNLTNSLPTNFYNPILTPMRFYDQSPTNALATGESHQYQITVDTSVTNPIQPAAFPLRLTLVWTDPPGNPSAAIKLVNDLDLSVSFVGTNGQTNVYYGNNFTASSGFTTSIQATNPPITDEINNVENVFINVPLADSYIVTVKGKRVNVNAVTAHSNNVVQDYALVISSSYFDTNGFSTAPFTVTNLPPPVIEQRAVQVITNGVPLARQHAGVQPALIGTTNGWTNQWNFYVFTNEYNPSNGFPGLTNGQNVAFITFYPPNLSGSLHLTTNSLPPPGVDQLTCLPYTGFVTNGTPRYFYVDVPYDATFAGNLLAVSEGSQSAMRLSADRFTLPFGVRPPDDYFPVVVPAGGTGGIFMNTATSPPDLPLLPGTRYFLRVANVTGTGVNAFTLRACPDGTVLTPAMPRVTTADIDLYVSMDPTLTNLNQVALDSALRHTNRGGNSLIILSNAPVGPGAVFYVGVKSEDARAAEYSLTVLSSDQPFAERTNGFILVRGIPVPMPIPDGVPDLPSVVTMFGINPFPDLIRRVVVSNALDHELYGDLFADVQHEDLFAVVYNHNLFTNIESGATNFVFEDSGRGDFPGSFRTDGPPGMSLNNFIGEAGFGTWQFTVADNALFHTGMVTAIDFYLEPQSTNDSNQVIQLCAGESYLDFVDVPVGATNLTVTIAIVTGTQFEMYIRRDNPATRGREIPTLTTFDKKVVINAPGGSLTLGLADIPPLRPGAYTIMIYNPTTVCQEFRGPIIQIDRNTVPGPRYGFADTNTPLTVFDDALMSTTNRVSRDDEIYSVEVGVRLDHPRVSDLALRLISPNNTRVTLFENRGTTNADRLGGGYPVTNSLNATSSGGFLPVTNTLVTGVNAGTLIVDFQHYFIPDRLTAYYDGARIFDSGYVNGTGRFNIDFGPGVGNTIDIVMNEGTNSNMGTAWDFSARVVSGIGYLVFTEDTNRFPTPIKFAVPPFGPLTGGASIPISGFEPAAAGDYPVATVPDGWTVTGNQVTVISDANLAQAGTNLLALADGTITRTLPTIAGRRYNLQFATRGPGIVSWWRGESNTVDSLGLNPGLGIGGLNYTPGAVGAGFLFNGSSSYIDVLAGASLDFTNALTLEMWFRDDNAVFAGYGLLAKRGNGIGPCNYGINIVNGGAGPYFNDPAFAFPGNGSDDIGIYEASRYLPNPALGVFHHIATTIRQAGAGQVEFQTFIDGVLVRTKTVLGDLANTVNANSVTIGTSSGVGEFMNGVIDEPSIYGRALSASEVAAIHRFGAAGKFDPLAPIPQALSKAQIRFNTGAPSVFFANNTTWQGQSFNFVATGAGTTVEITGLEPGMLLDSFSLTETVENTYVLPEESLDLLRGERTIGTWRLEIWDTRVGAALTNGLIAWDLRFIAANAGIVLNATPLVNCTPYSGTVTNGSPLYFIVDVPGNATVASNTLDFNTGTSTSLRLGASRLGAPSGTLPPDDYAPVNVGVGGSGTIGMSAAGFPPLLPGQRYYLSVEAIGAGTNAFTITACNDGTVTPFAPIMPALANGVGSGANLAAGLGINYSQFTVPSNATFALFELTGLNGNADLVLNRAGASLLSIPTRTRFERMASSAGSSNEVIYLDTATAGLPLAPGVWYLGVYNRDTKSVAYSVRATAYQVDTNLSIALTNDALLTISIPPGTTTTNVYRFSIDPGYSFALFEMFDLSGDADLFLGQDSFPSSSRTRISTHRGKAPEQVVVDVDPFNFDPTAFWLTVASHDTNPVSFTLRASLNQFDGMLLSAQALVAEPKPIVPPTTGLPLAWNSINGQRYIIDISSNLAGWVPYRTNVANSDRTIFNDTAAPGLGQRYYRVRQVAP